MWIARIQWRKRPLKTTETTIQGLKAANKHQRKNRHRKAFVTNLLFRYTKYCMRPNVITKEEIIEKRSLQKQSTKLAINIDYICILMTTIHYLFLTDRVNSTACFQTQKHLAWKALCPYEFVKINSQSLLSRSKTF